MFPKTGVPQNGWYIVENPIERDDLGGKPTIFGNIHIKRWFLKLCFLRKVHMVFLPPKKNPKVLHCIPRRGHRELHLPGGAGSDQKALLLGGGGVREFGGGKGVVT